MEETRKWVEEGGKVRGKGVMELKKKKSKQRGQKNKRGKKDKDEEKKEEHRGIQRNEDTGDGPKV